jgi:hypothetical protein
MSWQKAYSTGSLFISGLRTIIMSLMLSRYFKESNEKLIIQKNDHYYEPG